MKLMILLLAFMATFTTYANDCRSVATQLLLEHSNSPENPYPNFKPTVLAPNETVDFKNDPAYSDDFWELYIDSYTNKHSETTLVYTLSDRSEDYTVYILVMNESCEYLDHDTLGMIVDY